MPKDNLEQYLDDNGELKLVPTGEITEGLESLKSDHAELKAQMDKDREESGLAIEERKDDLDTAVKAVEGFSDRMEKLEKAVQTNRYLNSFGESAGELKDALGAFMGGFIEFADDGEGKVRPAGTKPSMKHLMEGVFVPGTDESFAFLAPQHTAIKRLQDAADAAYSVDACLRAQMEPNELQNYHARGGIKTLKTWQRFEALSEHFTKAVADLIDTSTEVANWIPTGYGSQLYEQIKLGLPLAQQFSEVAMPAPTYILPLDMNDHEALLIGEVTSATNANPYADGNFMNPGALASNKITLTAQKLRARYWQSQEANEDAVVAMLPFLQAKMRRGLGEAIEDGIVNGQVSGLDTGGTHFSKANPSVSPDVRDAWNGLRYAASTYTGSPATRVDQSNADATVTALRGLRAAMGEYGADPGRLFYLLGPFGYVNLLDDDDLMTVDKFGPQATVRTGSLAMVDGAGVLISRRMPENANASGVIDGVTTNRTLAHAVLPEAWILANRRRVTLGQTVHGSSDTTELYAFWRGDFQTVYQTARNTPIVSVPFIGELYNVKAA